MSTTKIAITIPQVTLARTRQAVRRGSARNVSAFLSAAAHEKLERDTLDEVLRQMDAEYGPVPKEARAWARKVLGR